MRETRHLCRGVFQRPGLPQNIHRWGELFSPAGGVPAEAGGQVVVVSGLGSVGGEEGAGAAAGAAGAGAAGFLGVRQ